MQKIIIAAVAKNFVIGKDGKMPWHISEELKHFKKTTLSYPLIMGRKTFYSFGNGKPLKGRLNCVVTRDKELTSDYDEVKIFHSIEDAENFCEGTGAEKCFIIGGAEIYKSVINDCDRLVLSFLKKEHAGDTYFPEIDENLWKIDSVEEHEEFDVYYYVRKLG